MARNVTTKLNGTLLTIVIDIAKPGEVSASGKTLVVASTEGNQTPDGMMGDWKLGLNLYKTNKDYVKPPKG